MKYWLVIFNLLVCCYQTIGQTNVDVVRAESETPVTTMPDKQAEFPGGIIELKREIFGRLNTSCVLTDSSNMACKISLRFIINEKGKVRYPTIVRGCPVFCQEYENQIIKAVQNLPDWKPALKGGHPVAMYYLLPITICFK